MQDAVSDFGYITMKKFECLQQGTLLSKEAFLKDDNEKDSSFQREVHLKNEHSVIITLMSFQTGLLRNTKISDFEV